MTLPSRSVNRGDEHQPQFVLQVKLNNGSAGKLSLVMTVHAVIGNGADDFQTSAVHSGSAPVGSGPRTRLTTTPFNSAHISYGLAAINCAKLSPGTGLPAYCKKYPHVVCSQVNGATG